MFTVWLVLGKKLKKYYLVRVGFQNYLVRSKKRLWFGLKYPNHVTKRYMTTFSHVTVRNMSEETHVVVEVH